MPGSKTKSSFSFPSLVFHVLLATTTIPGVVFASQPPQQQPLSDIDSKPSPALASLSSLFNAKASPDRRLPAPAVSICCGDSCCPSCCDQFRVRPTDLAYAYPAPTPLPSGQKALPLNTQRPCCTLGCADGACRLPKSTRSQRPETTPAPPGTSDRTASTIPKPTNTLNVVIGCCKKCKNCDQFVTTLPGVSFAAAPTTTAKAAAKGETNALQKQVPLGPGEEALCIGCGKCYPCDQARVVSYLSFTPQPSKTPGDDDLDAFVAAVNDVVIEGKQASSPKKSTTATTATATSSGGSSSSTSAGTDPEPTYYLGDEINDAINGQNQDILPLVVQSGVSSTADGSKAELITLLATIDFKLQENYISRRLLSELGLTDKVHDFPRGVAPQIAFLSFHQDKSVINASIVLDLVTGNAAAGTQAHFSNVRFFVFGAAPTQHNKEGEYADEGIIRIPDVILGDKFFREVGGLTVFPSFKTQVETRVKIVYPVHRGRLGGVRLKEAAEEGGDCDDKGKHDEL
ncbi:hypothetical protein DV737_g2355, partial [Chaetothyriales sp. CBS 132003]